MFLSLLEFIFERCSGAISGFAQIVLTSFGSDLTLLDTYIPAMAGFGSLMTSLGVMFSLVIMSAGLISSFVSPVVRNSAEHPVSVAVRGMLSRGFSSVGIRFSKYILTFVTQIQNAILNEGSSLYVSSRTSLPDTQSVIANTVSAVASGTGAFFFLALILLFLFASVYVKLLLQLVERYCILGILVYTSPLAFATGASGETSDVISSWLRMFAGQCVLILISTWGIQVVMYTTSNMTNGSAIAFIMAYAVTKRMTRLEDLLGKLNIHVSSSPRDILGRGTRAAIVVNSMMRNAINSTVGRDHSHPDYPNRHQYAGNVPVNRGATATDNTRESVLQSKKAEYDAKYIRTSDGKTSLSYTTDTPARAKVSDVTGGFVGKRIDDSHRSISETMTAGGGIYGRIRNISDLADANEYRRAYAGDINGRIDRVNDTFASPNSTVSADDLNTALNMHESLPDVEFRGTGIHSDSNDSYILARAEMTNRDGSVSEHLVAISPDSKGLNEDIFNVHKYMPVGDTGLRIYWQDNQKVRQDNKTYTSMLNSLKETKHDKE